MSDCRRTSFYVAPGVRLYFANHTVCAIHPESGSFVELRGRKAIHSFLAEHPTWSQVLLVGPPGGVDVLADTLKIAPEKVSMHHTSSRIVEGRRPDDPVQYMFSRWCSNGLESAGGARQVAETLFPGAGRSVHKKAAALAVSGDQHRLQVLSSAWRSGLLRDPNKIAAHLEAPSLPVKTRPDPLLEISMSTLVAAAGRGVRVDADKLVSELVDPTSILDAGALVRLARDPRTPAQMLRTLANHHDPNIRYLVANNDTTPPEALAALSDTIEPTILSALARNDSTPPEVLLRLVASGDAALRASLAHHRSLPPEGFDLLAADKSYDTGLFLASNPMAPPELLHRLSTRYGYQVSRNPSTPPEVLATLAASDDPRIRLMVAQHPATSVDTMLHLAARGHPDAVARNPSAPPDLLEMLIEDGYAREVARNHAAPAALLLELSKHPSAEVRLAVAHNSCAPPEALADLAREESMEVREALAFNHAMPAAALSAMAQDPSNAAAYALLAAVGAHANTPTETLHELSVHATSLIRLSVAGNSSTPPEVLEVLGKDPSANVRDAVAKNTSTPESVRIGLLDADERDALLLQRGEAPWSYASDKITGALLLPNDTKNVSSLTDLALADRVEIINTKSLPVLEAVSTTSSTDWKVEPIRNRGALRENATYMGNCTAGYLDSIKEGDSILFTATSPTGEVFNVALRRDGADEKWHIREINSRFNQGVDPETRESIQTLFASAVS